MKEKFQQIYFFFSQLFNSIILLGLVVISVIMSGTLHYKLHYVKMVPDFAVNFVQIATELFF